MRNVQSVDDLVGSYGQTWRPGVLTDHLTELAAVGGRTRVLASGRREVAVTPDGRTYPVVCGDIVEVATEDGPISGRCGADAVPGRYACAGHANERDAWQAMTEDEKVAWERRLDLELGR